MNSTNIPTTNENISLAQEKKDLPIKKKSRVIFKLLLVFFIVGFLKSLVIDNYKITSDSMEGNLLVGDYVFVSKYYYGARIPSSLGLPFVDNSSPTLKILNLKLFTGDFLPYIRLPKFSEVKRNDIIAFNLPVEENVPVDFKTVYIKRCVGIPGDKICIKDGNFILNNQSQKFQQNYLKAIAVTSSVILDELKLSQLGIKDYYNQVIKLRSYDLDNFHHYIINCDSQLLINLSKSPYVKNLKISTQDEKFNDFDIYPGIGKPISNKDNFPNIIVPQNRILMELDTSNSPYYYPILLKYEKLKSVLLRNKKIYVGNTELKSYKFKYQYYFVLGDNRSQSYDSRYWGFVPETHVLGKVLTIAFSKSEKGVRWNRIFKTIK